MALTVQTDGDLVGVGWWNDYYNLLTGVMTDQPVELNYRPGSGTAPTLKLDGDGYGKLIQGLKTDHSTEAFSIDSSGNLSVAGAATIAGALSGVTTLAASGAVTLSSTLAVTTSITRGGNTVWDAGNDGSGSGLDADKLDGSHASAFALLTGATFSGGISGTSGSFSGQVTTNSKPTLANYSASGSQKVYIQSSDPGAGTAGAGAVWIDTSVDLG